MECFERQLTTEEAEAPGMLPTVGSIPVGFNLERDSELKREGHCKSAGELGLKAALEGLTAIERAVWLTQA